MNLPQRMEQIEYAQAGGPEEMHLTQGERPTPATGEVLIRVTAVGVNRPDVLQRQGHYPAPGGASPLLGLEVAGEVVALGQGVSRWQLGDRVCALVNGGGYAQYACAPERQCLPIPSNLDEQDAAALPEAAFTVWHNLWQRAGLQAQETLLLHGAASGIGTTAIQMAKALGVKVITTAGGADKCRACEELGADAVINYKDEDYVTGVKRLTEGRGADVILDMVGGDYMQRNMSAAAKEGRIVNIAYLKGSTVEVNFMPVMLKRLTLTGSTLRAQSDDVKASIAKALEQHVWPLISAGHIKPQVNHRFSLAQAADAHRLMESNQLIGKIILIP